MIPLRLPAGVLLSYVAATLALSWPLPSHLATHLTGVPDGDAGVYVWNPWVFHHAVTTGAGHPYFTDRIFASEGGANLGLHNYTTFQNLLALPLIPAIGIVPAFNVIYLLMTVLTAWATFLLAKRVTGAVAESWLAGLLFAWSPLMVARGTGHFSLVAAAPLVVFLLLLLRAADRPRLAEGAALGATLWWAASTDLYYAVCCVLITALFLVLRVVSLERTSAPAPRLRRLLDGLILGALGLIGALLVTGGWELAPFGRPVRMHGLYTPVLLLTMLVLLRLASVWRARIAHVTWTDIVPVVRLASATVVVAAILMAPMLSAAAPLLAGEALTPPVHWRSSPSGANLLAFVLPSPLHPLAPDALVRWVDRLPGGFIENVVSVPIVALAVLAAAWRAGWTFPRWWRALTLSFGLLALGPFVQVGGIDTHVPGPWALLRYVPVIELARAPQRFAVLMMLGLAVLFAAALCWITRAHPDRRRLVLAIVGTVLLVELLPAPRTLYPAAIPHVYRQVAAAPGDRPVLEIPFGIRTGTLSAGNFTARSQLFQTAHGRPLFGGYVSRVPPRQLERIGHDPVLQALIVLSESRALTPAQEDAFRRAGPAFVTRTGVEFVVIDRASASTDLIDIARDAFRLSHVASDGPFDLYRPASPPD